MDEDDIKERIIGLRQEHRDLDDAIAALEDQSPYDQLRLQRMKKRKLALKDLTLQLEAMLHPNIIA